jgi:hypothetical protein
MPVGKARTGDQQDDNFQVVVPCFSALDEDNIRQHLKEDHSSGLT